MIGCCSCALSPLGELETLKAGCPVHGEHVRQREEQAVRDALLEASRRAVDDLKARMRQDTVNLRAQFAPVAPQDDDGVFTITTLAPQENP